MTSKSGIYLVSSKPMADSKPEKRAYENSGFDAGETKVEYNASNGVDIPEVPTKPVPTKPYRGMGKEDLLRFSSQPFWRRLRMICVSIILLGWLALIITVVALVLVYPSCRSPGSRSWWQAEAVYRIYVPSFKDSDDDGKGDLAGIQSKLDYIKELGFSTISLSAFYVTAGIGNFANTNDGAIINHKGVNNQLGTLVDFDNLVQAAHTKDMHVIVDFIPNHTSDQHPWFLESSNNTINPKKNYYVWSSGTTPPNNWKNHYNGSAWSLNRTRNQMYLHQFRPETPDLNLRSELVQEELEDILKFWMDHGVDGFNIRDAAFLYEDFDLRDDPTISGASSNSDAYSDYEHKFTSHQPEVYNVLERWRDLVNSYNSSDKNRVLMTPVDGGLKEGKLYTDCAAGGIHMPLNNGLLKQRSPCDGACMKQYVDGWINAMPSGKWATWMAGDDSSERLASRFNKSFIKAYTILTFLLPGTPVMLYGDEIYMIDTGTPLSPWSRDQPMRAVMRWDNSSNGGFCDKCNPWTDVGGASTDEIQTTLSSLIKELADLRAKPSFRIGDYFPVHSDDNVISFVTEFDGETGYLVAVNFGNTTVKGDFTGSHSTVPAETVVALSHGSPPALEDELDPTSLEIGAHGAVVVSWDYVAKEL